MKRELSPAQIPDEWDALSSRIPARLLLDEVAEMPLEIQSKLLGALQERQIYRVGGASSGQESIFE